MLRFDPPAPASLLRPLGCTLHSSGFSPFPPLTCPTCLASQDAPNQSQAEAWRPVCSPPWSRPLNPQWAVEIPLEQQRRAGRKGGRGDYGGALRQGGVLCVQEESPRASAGLASRTSQSSRGAQPSSPSSASQWRAHYQVQKRFLARPSSSVSTRFGARLSINCSLV